MKWRAVAFWGAFLGSLLLSQTLWAQDEKPSAQSSAPGSSPGQVSKPDQEKPATDVGGGSLAPGEDPENRLFLPLLKHMVKDQQTFWTFPAHLRTQDLRWIGPAAAFTGSVIASDSWIAKQVPQSASRIKQSKDLSNYALFSVIGVSGGSYLVGQISHNDHMQETGLLAGEAAIDGTAVAYVLKEITRRERPYQGNGHGTFFQGGSSFPSEHATAAWSAASVFAHEYPGTLSQIFAYGLASAVTVGRITSNQHFASDALIGSALGWYFGRQVYRAHHDPELGGTAWGSLLPESNLEKSRDPANMASPYVPLDSWVYPALERLSALGYIQTAYLGMRPWTRMECARLLEDAEEQIGDEEGSGLQLFYNALIREFADEISRRNGARNLDVTLSSVYSRATEISGTPLRDGYHFAQTISNDYGRPYWQGFNAVSGITVHGVAGPFSFSFNGEYQHAPAMPSYPAPVLQAMATADGVPFLTNGSTQIDKFALLDSSVSFTTHDLQFSFGKQSLWLGPTKSGPLLFSNNAAPLPMLRIDKVSPFRFPLLSHLLGPARGEFFLGQLSGQEWVFASPNFYGPNLRTQPFLHGTKISFKPTPNLEFGMGFTAQFGGPGLPFTWENFLRTFYSHRATNAANPGKRISAFDFSYRIPGMRDWLTVYTDSLVIDEYSPLGSTRPSINPGIYLSHVPKIPKLDFRAEGVSTDLFTMNFGAGAVYFDGHFHSGYTNDGMLMGSWIGRMGRGEQGWLTYWFSPTDTVQAGYRHQDVDRDVLEGGVLNNFSLRAQMTLRPGLIFTGYVQYENWRFHKLSPVPKTNVTSSIQLTWIPGRIKR